MTKKKKLPLPSWASPVLPDCGGNLFQSGNNGGGVTY